MTFSALSPARRFLGGHGGDDSTNGGGHDRGSRDRDHGKDDGRHRRSDTGDGTNHGSNS
ncbi:MAG: hypothetical protein QOG77_248 [Solirubrobacteraceae bacterium]|nr:hypothetical protein [Solirubrobacteraceae bacterium]